jgi:hypothetical protein
MRSFTGYQTQSLHLLHGYVLLDRIDISGLCDEHIPTCLPSSENIAISFLPSTEDDRIIYQNFATLISLGY